MIYWHIAVKLISAFILVMVILRLTGKNSIAQMTIIDVIGNMILGGIVGGIIYNGDIGIIHFIIILAIWAVIMLMIYYLQMFSHRAKRIIVGKPVELIRDNQLILPALSYCKLDITDLHTLLRMKGVNTFTEIFHAQLEPNGQLTVVKNGEVDFSYIVVKDGQILEDILPSTTKNKKWLEKALQKKGYDDLKSIFCVEYYDNDITVISNNQIKRSDNSSLGDDDTDKKAHKPATGTKKSTSRTRKPASKK